MANLTRFSDARLHAQQKADESTELVMNESRAAPPTGEAAVGVFWQVRHRGKPKLVAHAVILEQADNYGDFLTHPSGHYEVWESWRAAGLRALSQMGLPVEIANTEYEAHPRGRVVYNKQTREYTIYADPRLQHKETIREIAELFGISGHKYIVRSDAHYQRSVFHG
jgi:hypothetical protein